MFSFLFRRREKNPSWVPDPSRKLLIYIGWPIEEPRQWRKVESYDRERLTLDDGCLVDPAQVRSHLLVYPNDEVLNGAGLFSPLPPGLKFLESQPGPREPLLLDSAQVEFGKSICKVTHSRLRRESGKLHYATTMQNVSSQPIRIQRFAAFRPKGKGFVLSTVTGNYFTADQFVAWYAAPAEGWISPGGEATDESNYGSGGGAVWAYFGETKDGNHFVACVPVPA